MTDEEGITLCQTEIKRLRAVIRENRHALENALTINHQRLFELWAGFDNAEASNEVVRIMETANLAPVDGVSFTAFCYGYEQAIRHITEVL